MECSTPKTTTPQKAPKLDAKPSVKVVKGVPAQSHAKGVKTLGPFNSPVLEAKAAEAKAGKMK